MSDKSRALVAVGQRGVVASVTRQMTITEKLISRIQAVQVVPGQSDLLFKEQHAPVNEWLNIALELEEERDWPELLKHRLRWTQALPKMSMRGLPLALYT
ncbi:MAG: hypothetical protein K0B14_13565 [Anaerolineaceae bacterium]|nr:hypothetical protein [Anaerolineaceae bacterium]